MEVVKELADNIRLELKFPFSYGLSKLTNAVACVAIAYERGIDPNDLILNTEEKYQELKRQAQIIAEEGPGEVIGVITR